MVTAPAAGACLRRGVCWVKGKWGERRAVRQPAKACLAPWLLRIVCTAGSHSGCISASLLFVQSPDLGRWKFAGFLQVPGQSMASLWPFLKIISSTQMAHAALVFGSVQLLMHKLWDSEVFPRPVWCLPQHCSFLSLCRLPNQNHLELSPNDSL